ncbi:HD family phosphohydrolase [Clostridium pasteurianum]|nr:HD-GYP domain-containing protein [Clostridium pasteurianum]OMH21708.1 HD family phosphohydrolase [Clostridium pasteurianum]
MILVNPIKYDNIVLVEKGIPLTNKLIEKLREKYIYSHIEIYYELEEYTQKDLIKIEEDFIKLTFNLEKLFSKANKLDSIDMEDIRSFSAKIKESLYFTDSIIKNIVLYGSGKDSIYRHGVNVAALSLILGKWIGLDDKQLNLLTYASILHDFGKTKIDNSIINKVDKLTLNEINKLRTHPIIGYQLINKINFLDKSVANSILMHHEREDGSGYPLRLKADKIHPFAKIIAIADTFDAINSNRAYRSRKKPFEALQIIKEDSIGKLDYNYCTIFLNHMINYYMGENVLLSDDRVCKIIQIHKNDFLRPLLLSEDGFIDLKDNKDLYVKQLFLDTKYL